MKKDSCFEETPVDWNEITNIERRLYDLENHSNKKYSVVLFVILLGLGFFFGMLFPDEMTNNSLSLDENSKSLQIQQSYTNTKLIGGQHTFEPLIGDSIQTHKVWDLGTDNQFHIHIVDETNKMSQEHIDGIIEAITSEDSIIIDDLKLHKGPEGEKSTYYLGWQGALKSINASEIKFNIPANMHVHVSDDRSNAEVTIRLVSESNAEGYAGFTHSIMNVQNNRILQSFITIYKSDLLTVKEISAIAKHEMGHALGLAHSTDPDDLMYPTFEKQFNVSECNVKAITHLYDGKIDQHVECEK